MERQSIRLSGIVQGVGCRAFVHGLASDLRLTGFVRNEDDGVLIEVEGPHDVLEQFGQRLVAERPRGARIDNMESLTIAPKASPRFEIQPSR